MAVGSLRGAPVFRSCSCPIGDSAAPYGDADAVADTSADAVTEQQPVTPGRPTAGRELMMPAAAAWRRQCPVAEDWAPDPVNCLIVLPAGVASRHG